MGSPQLISQINANNKLVTRIPVTGSKLLRCSPFRHLFKSVEPHLLGILVGVPESIPVLL